MELSKDLSEFILLMNEKKVEYLIVGGWAVGYHSIPRFTGDIDFFFRASEENANRILEVLSDFGFGSLDITLADLTRPNFVIQLGNPPNRIDLITSIDGVDFESAWKNRVIDKIGAVNADLISHDDLITNKRSANRPKYVMDLHSLESMKLVDHTKEITRKR